MLPVSLKTRLRAIGWLLATLLLTAGIYHRLLVPVSGGYPGWTAVRWGLKDFMYPRLIFNSDAVAAGYFPLWNPYHYAGGPWVGNFQACLFQPLNWLVWLLGGHSALVLQYQLVAVFLLAAAGMFFCAREFGASRPASLAASLAFSGGGFFLGTGSYFPQVNTLALFPWALLFSRRLFRRRRWRDLLPGAVCLALLAAGGFPSLSFFLGLAVLAVGWGSAPAPVGGGAFSRPLGALLLAVFGCLLAAPLLLPAAESYPWLYRVAQTSDPSLGWEKVVAGKSLSPAHLLSAVLPLTANWDAFGGGLWVEFRNCYAGLLPFLFFGLFLIRGRGRTRTALAAGWLAAVFLAFGFHNPAYAPLYRTLLPVRLVSHPALDFRALFLALSSLMAALGFDECLRPGGKKAFLRIAVPALAAAGLALIWILRRGGFPPGADFSRSVFFWVLTAAASLGAVLVPGPPRLRAFVILAVLALDLVWWDNANFSTLGEPESRFSWERRAAKEAARERRVDRTDNLTRRQEGPRRTAAALVHKYFSDTGLDGTILRHFVEAAFSPARALFSAPFRVLALERAEVLEDREEVLARIRAGEDPARIGLVCARDVSPELAASLAEVRLPEHFRVEVTAFSPDRIVYEIELDRPAALLFNEIHYPGWRLYTQEGELPLFRVNHAFRGTLAASGRQRLIMAYRPGSFRAGLALALGGVLFLLAASVREKNRRRPDKEEG